MKTIKIKYHSDKIDKLTYIDGKSDWIDLRAAETVESECRYPHHVGNTDTAHAAILADGSTRPECHHHTSGKPLSHTHIGELA